MSALFFAGFALSLIGSLPPGLISLAVAYAAIQRGWRAALWVAAGASGVEFWQAVLATVAAGWFLAHPAAAHIFQWIALPVFLGAGAYLFFWAAPPRPHTIQASPLSPWRQLGQGALVSLFNLLALPYWFSYCAWLRVSGWWPEGRLAVVFFAAGVCAGTFAALSLYAWAARYMIDHSTTLGRSANRVIGGIFLLLATRLLLDIVTHAHQNNLF